MANMMDTKRHTGNCEAIVIDRVDREKWMTEEEMEAFLIVQQVQKPKGKRTRDWACKIMATVNKAKITALMSKLIEEARTVEDVEKVMDFFMPKAGRADQLQVGGIEGGEPIRTITINKVIRDRNADDKPNGSAE